MVGRRAESIGEKGQSNDSVAPAAASVAARVSFFDGEVRDCVCAPACLSFIALSLSARSSSSMQQCPTGSPAVDPSPSAALPSPPLMDSLLPSPFSTSSFVSFFAAHLPTHNCIVTSPSSSSSSALSFSSATVLSPSAVRWRRRAPEVSAAPSPNGVIKLSSHASLASLASSLPRFSSAEKTFVVEAKDDLKVGREGVPEHDDGRDGALPAYNNFIAGNARFRKEATMFFKQLPSELREMGRQRYERAAKRKDSGDRFELVSVDGASEKRAENLRDGQRKAIQTSKHLLAGAVAAMVSRTIVAPLERVKLEYLVRGATGNVVNTVRGIFLAEGVKGFWKGNGVNILRTAPFKSVNFFTYDTFRRQLLRWGDRKEVTNIERLAAGAAAGVTATILCFPLDTIRTLVVAPGGEAFGGMRGCFKHLIRTEGLPGLYRGLPAAVVSMAPSGAVFYGVYDILKSAYLRSPEGKEMLKARQKRAEERLEETSTQLELGTVRTLLFGALAGACAETVTYPLEVVRRAQQMQFAANKLGMIATVQALVKKGGVGALYVGILPSTLQVLPSAALSYFVYETAKIAFKIP